MPDTGLSQAFWYITLIPLFPAIGAFLNGVFGRKFFTKKVIHTIALGAAGLAFLVSVIAFFHLLQVPSEERHIVVTLYEWFVPGTLLVKGHLAQISVPVEFLLDPLSAVMLLVVTGVGFLIHIYSTGYMADDPGYHRFFSYLNLFLFAMLILVLGSSFLLLFVGWEGVGLCSYLLIGFYASKDSAANAGKKAFLVNRVGDLGFLIGMMLVLVHFGSLRFLEVFPQVISGNFQVNDPLFIGICLALLVGVTGKSAQIPLYVWLPDAMEGPTPVSALIHAATMVTAGVYLIVRCNALFQMAPQAMVVVAIIGAATALYAATIGTTQFDIKRVLAYSTISQLGYMVLAAGVAAFSSAIFHLVTHAFFKALLFLGAGSIIHAMHHQQDMRYMGGLKKYMPTTYWTFTAATLAITGFPLLSGFCSKDEILAETYASSLGGPLLWLVGVIAAGFTSFYMFRAWFMTFHGEERFDEHTREHLHESPKNMTIPLAILGVLSIIGGIFGFPKLFRVGPLRFLDGLSIEHFLEPSIYHVAKTGIHHTELSHAVEWGLMGTSVAAFLIGLGIAYVLYVKRTDLPAKIADAIRPIYVLVFNKYYVDEIYSALIVRPVLRFGEFLAWFDRTVIDGVVNGTAWMTGTISSGFVLFDTHVVDGLVNGAAEGVAALGRTLRRAHTGVVQSYVYGALTIAFFFIFVFLLLFT